MVHALIKSCIVVTYRCIFLFPFALCRDFVFALGALRTLYVLRRCFDTPNNRTGGAIVTFNAGQRKGQGLRKHYKQHIVVALHWRLQLSGVPAVYTL